MSNIEIGQPASTTTALTLTDLNARLDQMQAEQAAQGQTLTEMVEAIEALPDSPSWGLQRVRIADFDIPFSHLVGFMVKVAIASIPAAIVVAIIYAVLFSVFSTVILSTLRSLVIAGR